jgi:Spy/CpxP family protein refolding chaperone
MEPTTKNRALYIVLAILVLLNLVSVGSMWMMRFCGRPPMIEKGMEPGMHPPPGVQGPNGMQGHFGDPNQMDGKMFLAKELKFTPGQSEKFAKLRDEHFSTSRKLIDEMHKSMDDMMDLIKSGGDEKKADEFANITVAKQKELQVLAFKHFKSIREICDDKQKEKFDSIIKDVSKMMAPQGPPPINK